MIPLAELLVALSVDVDVLEEDNLVHYERAAVAHVQQRTDRYFGPPALRTEYLVTSGAREVWLSELPVALPPSTMVIVMASLNGVAVEDTAFTVRGRALRHASAYGWGVNGDLAVTYAAGYPVRAPATSDEPIEDVDAPEDVRQAVKLLVGHWYTNRIPVALGTVAPEIALTVRDLLAPWRKMGV